MEDHPSLGLAPESGHRRLIGDDVGGHPRLEGPADYLAVEQFQHDGLHFDVCATRHEDLRTLTSESLRSFARQGIVRPDFAQPRVNELLPATSGISARWRGY